MFKELNVPGFEAQQVQEIYPLQTRSKPALNPTQSSIQWAPVFLNRE